MRRQLGAIAVAACLAACGSTTASQHQSAEASCVGPVLTVSASDASPGSTLAADGEWYAADCYDTGQPGLPPPLTGLSVSVRQGGKSWRVASGVDAAGDHFTFQVSVVLPTDLQPGPATIQVDGYGGSATLHIQPAN